MEGTKIRPRKREIGILWEVVYSWKWWKMPTSCLCSRTQVKITCLCLASACESFAYISGIGCGRHLIFFLWAMVSLFWELKYSLLVQTNLKKNPSVCACVKRTKTFSLSMTSFFSGLWQILFPPSSQGLPRTCVKLSKTWRNMLVCPRFLLQSPSRVL